MEDTAQGTRHAGLRTKTRKANTRVMHTGKTRNARVRFFHKVHNMAEGD